MELGFITDQSSAVRISAAAAGAIHAAMRRCGDEEACGLLFGVPGEIREATVAANVSPEPGHRFEIDPAHLFDAYRRSRAGPLALLGCWHSHPDGRAVPSRRDRDGVSDMAWLWLIATEGTLALWRPVERGFEPVALIGPGL
jgi:proteasome lid subunit RPN8/RPN11